MRVTGGDLAGRKIVVPRRADVRPTADRVRESVFARLGDLEGQAVLDLFAGSGALGIEALSRGAGTALFVDRAETCTACIRANLEALDQDDRSQVWKSPARAALARMARERRQFDLVLLDPPYASGEARGALEALAAAQLVAETGMVVLECDHRHDPGPVAGLRRSDERRYGDTLIARYEPEASSV